MEAENFSLQKANDPNLSLSDTKLYIDKYFIPLDDGTHAVLKNGKYVILETPIIKSTYFNRMSKALSTYYFKEKMDLRTLIYDFNKPVLTATELNICPQIKHKEIKTFASFDKEIRVRVGIMLYHIKEILCDSKEDIYQFLLKWFANMIRGNKNDSCLYCKGPQGGGKSTVFDFFIKHVIGNELCIETGSGPLKTKFNAELAGKLFVIFEELENFSSAEWISISSTLKRQITSNRIMIEAKGVNAVEHKNLNNYAIACNNDAITDDDGRRYFIVPMSAKRIGDHEYFDNIHKKCFNDLVGHAMYCYLLEIDLTNYNAQLYPITDSKLDSISKRLDNVYKFLKDDYVLKSIGINKMKLSELYKEYSDYCIKFTQKIKGKIDFNGMLKNVGIEPIKSNGNNLYTVSYNQLKALSDKFHWVHKLDTDKCTVHQKGEITINIFKCDKPIIDDYEYGIEKQNLTVNIIELQYKKFQELVNIKNEVFEQIDNNNKKKERVTKPAEKISFDELRDIYGI